MPKHNIGILHYTYPPVIGGVEKVVHDHARLFAKNSYTTKVVTGDGSEINSKIRLSIIPEMKSLKITDLYLYKKTIHDNNFPKKFYELSNLLFKKLEIELRNSNIVFIHNILTLTFNLSLNLALSKYIEEHPEKKFISWTHDVALGPNRKRIKFNNPEIERMIYQPVKNVQYIGISNFLKQTLENEIGFDTKGMVIVPNGIDIRNYFELNEDSNKIINKFNIYNYSPVIFIPGKVQKYKNVDKAVMVTKEIKDLKKKPLLVLSAKGSPHNKDNSYLFEVKSLIEKLKLKENTIFLEDEIEKFNTRDSFKIIKDFYKISDIVFNFSNFENFGLPLIEAGLYRVPLVINSLSVFKDVAGDNAMFVDVEKESSKSIAKKIINLLETNQQSKLFNKIKKEYNLENIFKDKIEPLVNSKKNPPKSKTINSDLLRRISKLYITS